MSSSPAGEFSIEMKQGDWRGKSQIQTKSDCCKSRNLSECIYQKTVVMKENFETLSNK